MSEWLPIVAATGRAMDRQHHARRGSAKTAYPLTNAVRLCQRLKFVVISYIQAPQRKSYSYSVQRYLYAKGVARINCRPRATRYAFDGANCNGKSIAKRFVSIRTREIHRAVTLAEDRIEYEYEYRDAEYEYEEVKIQKP